MGKLKLSKNDKEEIVAAIEAKNATMSELAQRYGVSVTSISYVVKKLTGKIFYYPLSQSEKETIVSELKAGNMSMRLLAKRYGVNRSRISQVFKEMTGGSYADYMASVSNGQDGFQNYQRKMKRALKDNQYRAWHKEEKNMYPVLGINWFNQTVLIATTGAPEWYSMDLFILMGYSGLRDSTRTLEYPKG